MTSRISFFLIAVAVASLLLAGFFLEQMFGLTPCPLCILQRILYFAVLLAAVFAAWPTALPVRTVRLHAALIAVLAGLGAATAGRQIWLLSLPRDIASGCAVVFGSWFERTLYALGGTADCLDQTWEILWLTIPEWSLLWFGFLAFVSLILCLRAKQAALARSSERR